MSQHIHLKQWFSTSTHHAEHNKKKLSVLQIIFNFYINKKIYETNKSYVFVASNNLVFHILFLGMSRLNALI